ncbi:MAG: family 43 glycosylhydrolase [Chitinispirillaceae bacterium]|nr:family 43 glycosylhydrolase [Chitinispirillaceae bacterium]
MRLLYLLSCFLTLSWSAGAQLADPMVAGNWTKSPNPLFSYSDTAQIWGPGHASFTKSPDGTQDWIIYHAKISNSGYTDRLSFARQFTWNANGTPNFGIPTGRHAPGLAVPSGDTGTIFLCPIKPTCLNGCTSPDPWVYRHTDGYYYGMHTVFEGGYTRRLDMYRSRYLHDIFKNGSPKTIFAPTGSGTPSWDYWAPELHYVNGRWYIYFSGDQKTYVLSTGSTDPYNTTTSSWTCTRLVSNIDDWAIDGTVLQSNGNLYFIWSGIDTIVSAAPGSKQKLFISRMNSPTQLAGNRVMISYPQYSWEQQGTSTIRLVNEGPEILRHNGKVYCIYSASFTETYYYCLGMLTLGGTETSVKIPHCDHPNHEAAAAVTFRAVAGTITLSPRFHGRPLSISVYDLGGKLLKRSLANKNFINLKKDLGLSGGVYIVRVAIVP